MYVAICLLVDRSGSMQSIRAGLEEALVGSLAEQTKEAGLTAVDVAVFNTAHELTHRMADPDPATTGWGLTEGQKTDDQIQMAKGLG